MRTLTTLTCLALLLTTTSELAAQRKGSQKGGFQLEGAVVREYKAVGDVKLHLHIFNPKGWRPSDSRPAIVFFFGGGWNGGSPAQFHQQSLYLASRGMVAISAEYRVKSRHGTSPFECVADGKSAVRWVRAHAKELGVDPDRIAAGGGSAGGHVAAATGVIDGLDDPNDDLSVSSKPSALVLFNPVIDCGPKGYGHSRLGDQYKKISPVDHVTPGDPPTILFHGTGDTTVPVDNARDFKARMLQAENRCELVEFEGKPHGFFNYGRYENGPFVETMRAADKFLASLGYLEGEPTVK